MNRYLFDTNLLLLLLRQDARWDIWQDAHKFDESFNFLSVVSLGELYSIGLQNNWGIKRLVQISQLQEEFVVADIHVESIIQRYAEIDAFSQGETRGETAWYDFPQYGQKRFMDCSHSIRSPTQTFYNRPRF